MGALPNMFYSQMFLIYFLCAFLIAIPHFAFNHTSLHITCVLLKSKVYANVNPKLLALATANAKVFNAFNAFKNATLFFLSKNTLI